MWLSVCLLEKRCFLQLSKVRKILLLWEMYLSVSWLRYIKRNVWPRVREANVFPLSQTQIFKLLIYHVFWHVSPIWTCALNVFFFPSHSKQAEMFYCVNFKDGNSFWHHHLQITRNLYLHPVTYVRRSDGIIFKWVQLFAKVLLHVHPLPHPEHD